MSSGRGRQLSIGFFLAVFAVAAGVFWAVMAGILGLGASVPLIRELFLATAVLYCMAFGLAEFHGIPIWPPSLAWQVPARWLTGRSPHKQGLLWGITLGPGALTVNRLAGMWVIALPALATGNRMLGFVGTVLAGMVHGTARGFAIISNVDRTDVLGSLLLTRSKMRWRFADGLLLLVGSGALLTSLILGRQ